MPAFAFLSDEQIATLGNYLQKNYGNPNAAVTPAQVKTLRAGGASSNLVMAARAGMAAAVIVLLGLIFAFVRRKRRAAR